MTTTTSTESQLLHCYNKGCGNKFDPKTNSSDSCIYHPGPPYFHDAYKIWNCCNKKTTDFSTWFTIPGCTRGPHNPDKPPEPEKPPPSTNNDNNSIDSEKTAISNNADLLSRAKPPSAAVRLPSDTSLIVLKVNVDPSLSTAIDQNMVKMAAQIAVIDNDPDAVMPDAVCSNKTCGVIFDKSHGTVCRYHPGQAIFHETLKYWTCCNKKSVDFDDFLNQIGCTSGDHIWTKPSSQSSEQTISECKHSWFMAGNFITITLYCKGTLPDQSKFSANGVNLQVDLVYNFGTTRCSLQFPLWGEIDPIESHVQMSERKVEISLRKKGTANWPQLVYKETK